MELIKTYFPELNGREIKLLKAFSDQIKTWNIKLNLVSRKDVNNLEERHILHSLAIAKFIRFSPQAQVLDLGTGGGFPGIPLAIIFPETHFTLIDARAKKIYAVREIASALKLNNVSAIHIMAEDHKDPYDFVLTRAVSTLYQILQWSKHLISSKNRHSIPNGIIAFKGGNFQNEFQGIPNLTRFEIQPILDYYNLPFFEEKYLVYLQI